MTFIAPERLLLLAVPLALALAYLWAQRRRPQYAVRFTNLELLDKVAPRSPGWRRHLPAFALLGALVALTVATARPAMSVEVPQEEATVILAVDVSLSMMAEDVEPDRLAAAQEAAHEFLDQVPEEIKVGLISFSGTVKVLVPPTTEHEQVATGIERLRLGPGTAIGEAIFAALSLLEGQLAVTPDGDTTDRDTPDPVEETADLPASILILSDGETTSGRPDAEAAALAAELGVPVSTVAFGTDQGVVFLPEGVVPVPVNEQAMAAVAEATGGEFFEADSADDLRSVFEGIGSEIGRVTEQREIADWFAIAGLLLAAAGAAASIAWFSRLP